MLEDARERIGELLGANVLASHADRVIFTSGGTEANNLAILGLANDKDCRVGIAHHTTVRGASSWAVPTLLTRQVTSLSPRSNTPALQRLADELARRGLAVDRLGVDSRGVIRVDELADSNPS